MVSCSVTNDTQTHTHSLSHTHTHTHTHTRTPPPLLPRSVADLLLQHLYRWLSSPTSQLYHPTLHRAVSALMAKLFAQMVAELKRLGVTIISANFNSIRLCTGKRNIKV